MTLLHIGRKGMFTTCVCITKKNIMISNVLDNGSDNALFCEVLSSDLSKDTIINILRTNPQLINIKIQKQVFSLEITVTRNDSAETTKV